jgi:hypothetical protein
VLQVLLAMVVIKGYKVLLVTKVLKEVVEMKENKAQLEHKVLEVQKALKEIKELQGQVGKQV